MRQNPHVRICGGARVSNDPGLPDRDLRLYRTRFPGHTFMLCRLA